MEASANNKEIEFENIERSESDMIISHIKQFVTLRDSAEICDRKVQKLKKHMSNLIENNYGIERNLDKLEHNVIDIDTKMMRTEKIHVEKKEELMDLQNARSNILCKKWNNCLSKIGNYVNSFCQWITEYSRDILEKDIENHQKECEKTRDELSIFKQEVEETIRKCDLNYIETNMDDLQNFDSGKQQ